MKKIINITRNGIYLIALVILICTVLCGVFRLKPAVVISGSMEPAIKTGSLILVNQNDKDVSKGDIIAFKAGDLEVAHRVAKIVDGGYITKGDSNKTEDTGKVTDEMLEGTVILTIPKAGYIVKKMTSTSGMIVMFAAAAALLTAGYLTDKEGSVEKRE